MICSLFNFYPQSAHSRRHEEALVGLTPQTKLQVTKLKHDTINQWSFCQFLECQAHPPHKRIVPLLETF